LILGTSICSWCNANAICENTDFELHYTLSGVSSGYDGIYSEVFSNQGIKIMLFFVI
jgi:hypothetical protein